MTDWEAKSGQSPQAPERQPRPRLAKGEARPGNAQAMSPALQSIRTKGRPAPGTGQNVITPQAQQRAFRSAQRHTKRVKWLKWSLPLLAIVIIVSFVGWVIRQKPLPVPVSVAKETTVLGQDRLIMQNPHLKGYSGKRAYEVNAEQAIQEVKAPDIVELEKISAKITDEEEQWANVTAKTGLFDQSAQTLDLDGDVRVTSSLGYSLETASVAIQMEEGAMQTKSAVNIYSKDVALSADRLDVINSGEVFQFTGNVALRIDAALLNKDTSGTHEAVPAGEGGEAVRGEDSQ